MPYEEIKELILAQCEGVEHSKFEEIEQLLNSIPDLREATATLHALYAGGVDNWEGYAMALDMLDG